MATEQKAKLRAGWGAAETGLAVQEGVLPSPAPALSLLPVALSAFLFPVAPALAPAGHEDMAPVYDSRRDVQCGLRQGWHLGLSPHLPEPVSSSVKWAEQLEWR